eukprot:2927799-Amphidinium_carterae.1
MEKQLLPSKKFLIFFGSVASDVKQRMQRLDTIWGTGGPSSTSLDMSNDLQLAISHITCRYECGCRGSG